MKRSLFSGEIKGFRRGENLMNVNLINLKSSFFSIHFWRAIFIILNFCFLSGTVDAQEKRDLSAPKLEQKEALVGEVTTYTLGKGDVVKINVRGQPEFEGNFVIGPDGNIQYTFLGDIKAEGLTKQELKEIIIEKLKRFVKIPEVSVAIVSYRSKFVYILGEVRNPGKYPMKGDKVSLRDAIISAGLPTPAAALRRVYVIKPDVTKPVYRRVDLYRMLYKGILKDNLILSPGDVVVVPSTIPSEINRALEGLLSPITRAAVIDDLLDRHR
ncbi:MAG: hypothetical protein B6D56_01580 [Candidatus Omnitrophica bacterium 4484_70.1]|nr:MAG: hypothetical protein B6D56_01580 [Candidatus Omnitrophica bacterium 4484_70.1]